MGGSRTRINVFRFVYQIRPVSALDARAWLVFFVREKMTKRVDPKWQKVQEETLVNWANATLRGPISKDGDVLQIVDLKEDIKDGSILMELLDNVSRNLGSGKGVRRRYNNPRLQVQMRENILECFNFIESEDIKLVNIGENFGLKWRLILIDSCPIKKYCIYLLYSTIAQPH